MICLTIQTKKWITLYWKLHITTSTNISVYAHNYKHINFSWKINLQAYIQRQSSNPSNNKLSIMNSIQKQVKNPKFQ